MIRRNFLKSLVAGFFIASAVGLDRVLGSDEPEEPKPEQFDINGAEYESFGELIDAINARPDGWHAHVAGEVKWMWFPRG